MQGLLDTETLQSWFDSSTSEWQRFQFFFFDDFDVRDVIQIQNFVVFTKEIVRDVRNGTANFRKAAVENSAITQSDFCHGFFPLSCLACHRQKASCRLALTCLAARFDLMDGKCYGFPLVCIPTTDAPASAIETISAADFPIFLWFFTLWNHVRCRKVIGIFRC